MPPPPIATPNELRVNARTVPGLDAEASSETLDVPVMVELTPPDGSARTPCDFCCVVDTSGSMGTQAVLKGDEGVESNGLSVLDVVKHAIHTMIHNLTDQDRLAVIAYSDVASTVVSLTEMSDNGKEAAKRDLDNLEPAGCTNLWDGLKKGVDELKTKSEGGRMQHIMLFTDGLPNINPPRGILKMVSRLKDQHGGKLPCTLSTFGFGYELDTPLLLQLGIEGSGTFAFIPDAGFVGTVFVNAMSNLLVTMAKDAQVKLEAMHGATFADTPILGGYPCTKAQDGKSIVVNVGSLQCGQRKQLIAQMVVPQGAVTECFVKATVECRTRDAEPSFFESSLELQPTPQDVEELEAQRLRLQVVDCIRKVSKMLELTPAARIGGQALPLNDAQALVQNMLDTFDACKAKDREDMLALKEDLAGQISEAISRPEWYNKWGVHYLPSLMIAHLAQQCNNFKDAGVQHYGGDLFNQVRDEADEIFLKLPPPKPLLTQRRSSTTTTTTAAAPARPPPQDMAAFHDRNAGCFAGDSLVLMADGTERRASDVRKGDVLAVPLEGRVGAGEVLCAIWTRPAAGRLPLVTLGSDLRITPYHPICLDGEWKFPLEVAEVEEGACDVVCTFLLKDGGSAVVVHGIACATLGHGLTAGAAKHAYYGSWQAVHDDLKRFPSYASGIVELSPSSVLRDPVTGQVCGLNPGEQ